VRGGRRAIALGLPRGARRHVAERRVRALFAVAWVEHDDPGRLFVEHIEVPAGVDRCDLHPALVARGLPLDLVAAQEPAVRGEGEDSRGLTAAPRGRMEGTRVD